jgi:hypothetical protein
LVEPANELCVFVLAWQRHHLGAAVPRTSIIVLAILGPAILCSSVQADQPPKPMPVDVPALIDKLVDVKDAGFKHLSLEYWNRDIFLPVDNREDFFWRDLFKSPPVRSTILREIVKSGADALPHLITHLDDKRRTGIFASGENYHFTVGDLCYVAIGQIVNRPYEVMVDLLWAPPHFEIVSPTRSATVRKRSRRNGAGSHVRSIVPF